MDFFEKNLENSQNDYLWQIFPRKRLKWYFFLKMSFHLTFEVFLVKMRKIIKVGKVRKYDDETDYFEKKSLPSL